jgi:hypothetical protein
MDTAPSQNSTPNDRVCYDGTRAGLVAVDDKSPQHRTYERKKTFAGNKGCDTV